MGGCFSSPAPEDAEARQRTQDIDRRIDEDYKRLRKEVKILLLGNLLMSPACMLTSGQARANRASQRYSYLHFSLAGGTNKPVRWSSR